MWRVCFMAEVVAPHRDYVLNAEERGDYVEVTIDTGGKWVLEDGSGYWQLEDASGDWLLEDSQVVDSPELVAPHRDYVLVADEPEYA